MGYRYPLSADWTLKDVSLSKKIAVLGRSGAGKSTLLHVLCGQRVPGDRQGDLFITYAGSTSAMLYHLESETLFVSHINSPTTFVWDEAMSPMKRFDKPSSVLGWITCRISSRGGAKRLWRRWVADFPEGKDSALEWAHILLQSNPVVLLDEPTTGLERETELDLRYFRFLRIAP